MSEEAEDLLPISKTAHFCWAEATGSAGGALPLIFQMRRTAPRHAAPPPLAAGSDVASRRVSERTTTAASQPK